MLLSLKPGIIYGPVRSRRLGHSLGVNLMPGTYKFCSFNCVYCHFGWTRQLAVDPTPFIADLPRIADVTAAVEAAARSDTPFDYITFSGNGEATLHPSFPELVDEIIRIRDRYRPGVKTALLSNSTGLIHERVRQAVSKIDFPMFKLDAGTEATFRAINRPADGIDLPGIVERLSSLSDILIQSIMIDGSPSNVTDEELTAYFSLLKRIRPVQVHIYSIDRPVPKTGISLVPPQRLQEIADRGRRETGLDIKPFYPAAR
jgi:wyosine [tRNA(Phe)-imidazoG37] synthetase (radical SAM superfamily)